ncbi:hypothetical protein CYG49_02980 [Candidatus Saccharibacteria bacterium]|nr:MAG: hypothetical protein CYG49_02980 [Candidatus Saccharibacteria bacterium]
MLKKLILIIGLLPLLSFTVATTVPTPVSAGPACEKRLLTLPSWHRGLTNDECRVVIDEFNDIWLIVINIIEIALQAAAYTATGFIIWGGIKYVKSQGRPDHINGAKMTIIDATIGLGIALSAVALVNFGAGIIGS